ncbi:Hypothetical protein POVN_LOCUS198 [uncultured virus]|nr:Hypothetical protein POVN_LOCUS198 [uncultured virus]
MMNYCTGFNADGTKVNSDVWIQRWLGDVNVGGQTFSRPCYHNLYRNMYDKTAFGCTGLPAPIVPNSNGYIYAQDLVTAMISRYNDDGGRLDVSESGQGNDQLNGMIWQICNQTPGLCQSAMYRYCATTTLETLTRSAATLPWCGCYMDATQYSKYTDLYQISRECTPTCNVKGVLPLPSADGVGTRVCTQSTCVIDDVSIMIAQSVVGASGGGIQFSQLCSSCQSAVEGSGTGTCTCLLTGATFQIINSQIGNVNISQECGTNAVCYTEQTRPDGSIASVRIPCDSDGGYNPYAEIERIEAENLRKANNARNLKIVLVLVLVFIAIIVLWFLFRPHVYNTVTPLVVAPVGGSAVALPVGLPLV